MQRHSVPLAGRLTGRAGIPMRAATRRCPGRIAVGVGDSPLIHVRHSGQWVLVCAGRADRKTCRSFGREAPEPPAYGVPGRAQLLRDMGVWAVGSRPFDDAASSMSNPTGFAWDTRTSRGEVCVDKSAPLSPAALLVLGPRASTMCRGRSTMVRCRSTPRPLRAVRSPRDGDKGPMTDCRS